MFAQVVVHEGGDVNVTVNARVTTSSQVHHKTNQKNEYHQKKWTGKKKQKKKKKSSVYQLHYISKQKFTVYRKK